MQLLENQMVYCAYRVVGQPRSETDSTGNVEDIDSTPGLSIPGELDVGHRLTDNSRELA